MLKNLLRIPDTFDPDDRRRRQILNIVLIIFIISGLLTTTITSIFYSPTYSNTLNGMPISGLVSLALFAFGILLVTNRSSKVPSWLSGATFIVILLALLTNADAPNELYNGRSLNIWAFPIMLGAILLHPGSVFLIAGVIFGFMELFTPSAAGGVNYYAMNTLFVIACVVWLGMTITNRAIRDARRQAANNEAILKSIADGVLVLDLQGNILSANPALLNMIPQTQLAKIASQPLGETLQWKRKIFSVSASAVPEVGTVAVFRDETRRHETERARDALIATASHELRTPLAAVMNYLELLLLLSKQGKTKSAEFSEHLERALENSKRLQHLVNDILDQAQIQAGVLELKSQSFDLRVLLERTRQLLDGLIKEKKLAYELNVELDVPMEMVGDAERLHQVLVNLIGNAIKFTDRGGIKVSVAVPRRNELYIQVADSGPGIPPEQLPDIFEAFRRGSNYAQRERQGAGLGLSIARELITRMGGEIFVTSEPGTGSVFTITLPVDES
jgi:signal transduction histidine kinase